MTDRYVNLRPGDPAPDFMQATNVNERFTFGSTAGRYLVLLCYGLSEEPLSQEALAAVEKNRKVFDDNKISLFGVTADPRDRLEARVKDMLPGVRHFWDFDGKIGKLYGMLPLDANTNGHVNLRRFWMVIDPNLRVREVFPFSETDCRAKDVIKYLKALPPVDEYMGGFVAAPILQISNVFEPELCAHLINLYKQHGGEESGFMREENGLTVAVKDRGHKSRSDFTIEDDALIRLLQGRIHARIKPEIAKVHQFNVTRMERYLVGCYDAASGGHFSPHRDNTTKGTAHRRFAVSINLNDEFEGGEVGFPEYGSRLYKPKPGSAVVFSCSLLHRVTPVTSGQRFAFLPFLYDDAAAAIREQNLSFLAEESDYKANRG